MLFVVFALALVSLFAWLVFRAMKSLQPSKYKNGKIEVLASIPVGARERVMIVQHRETEYVLGVTSGGISVLDKFPLDKPKTDVSA